LTQGKSVAESFLDLPGWKVRGISRNPSSDAAKALSAQGVEVVQGDLDNKATLVPAFEGATAIFANTDFFAPFYAAVQSPEITQGCDPRKHAYDAEYAQGINIAEVAASPTVLKTLTHFFWSTLCSPKKTSRGKYGNLYHYEIKEDVTREIEMRFPELAARMDLIAIGYYVTNWQNFRAMAPQKQSDGSYTIERTFSADNKVPFIYTHKDTGPFVRALVGIEPGKRVNAHSEELTMPQFAEIFAKEMGVKATYRQVSYDEHFAGVPEAFRAEFVGSFKFVDEFGWVGAPGDFQTAEEVSRPPRMAVGANTLQLGIYVPRTSMAEYIRQEDWSSVL
jgi:hypothetical protein